jgi:hypothetical protein
MPSRPLALSDDQLTTIMRTAQPIAPNLRPAYLEAVARALHGRELGDGLVARVCAELQREFFDPPVIEKVPSRWDRVRPDFERASRRAY